MTTVNVHQSGTPVADQSPLVPRAQGAPSQDWQPPTSAAVAPRPQHQLADTPSEAVVKNAVKSARVKDRDGRMIGIIRPSAGFRMRLMRTLGNELTKNEVYFGHAMLAACVRELDGEAVPAPTSSIQLEALVERLDDAGLDAIAQGMQTEFGLGGAQNEEAIEAAKN